MLSFYFSRATPILQVYHMTWLIEHLILRRKRAYRTLGQIPMPRGCALKDWELIQLIFLRKWNGWSRSPPIMIRRSRSHFGLNSDGLPFHFNFLPAAPFNSPSLFSLEICNSSLIVPPRIFCSMADSEPSSVAKACNTCAKSKAKCDWPAANARCQRYPPSQLHQISGTDQC